MIETPAAAILTTQLVAVSDFFSIGTNDLVQYVLGADRSSAEVAPFYQPLHPAVLRTLKSVLDTARQAGKKVSVCGEMAGNLLYTGILLGLGARDLSLTPGEIPTVKKLIRSINIGQAEKLANRALELSTTEEVQAELKPLGMATLLGS